MLEVTTSYLQGKYGVEIRIEFANKDNSHSCVRISHGLNKFVTNLNKKDQDDNEQENSEMQFEDNALRLNASVFASRSIWWSVFAERFPAGRWSFLGPGSETKWYSTYNVRPGGEWNRVAELMMIKFGERGQPVFRATSPLSLGTLKSKGGGKLSFHFCADGDTIETVFRTIISVNQLNIYGAVADMCEEYKSLPCKNGETCTGRTI